MPILNCLTYASGAAGVDDYSSWFGTGEDGDLTVSTDVALPVALDSGQIIKQYNNLTITSTGVLHPANRCNGMILLVKGDLTVDGTIHVDKCAPLANDNEELAAQEQHIMLCGVTAGGKGGDGATSNGGHFNGSGGAGGAGFQFGGGFGGGGGAGSYMDEQAYAWNGGAGDPRPPAGAIIPYPSSTSGNAQYGAGGSSKWSRNVDWDYDMLNTGGGGPGGGGAINYAANVGKNGGTGDAIGGGALWIYVGGKVRINSTASIRATGGKGGNGVWGEYGPYSGSGGGGGGGIVCIVHTGDVVTAGAVTASGGTGGTTTSTRPQCDGQDGSSGTVLITNIADLLGEGGDGYEWATISTVSGGAGTRATGVYCVTSEDGHPIAVELSGQQQIPILVGSYLRDNYSWTINKNISDVEAVGSKLYLVKGDVFLSFMGPS